MGRYPPITPLVGEQHGHLEIIHVIGKNFRNRWLVDCRCDCGRIAPAVLYANLRSGNTTSCGCERDLLISRVNYKHGETATRLWNIWAGMHQRCEDPTHNSWADYGRRGVTVCKAWAEYIPFRDWALANGYEAGLTLDRINNNRGYIPSNCRWATRSEQAQNRRNTRKWSYAGESKTIAEWSKDPRCVVSRKTLHSRLYKGWPVHDALTIPLG